MSNLRALIVTATVLALGACGIQTDSAPHDLREDERSLAISDSSSGTDASGADRIYLVAPGEERLLRSVPLTDWQSVDQSYVASPAVALVASLVFLPAVKRPANRCREGALTIDIALLTS